MIPALWHHNHGFWDCALPRYILDRAATAPEHVLHFEGLSMANIVRKRVGVIVIPGRHTLDDEQFERLNSAAGFFQKIIFVIIGDEEGVFPAARLAHKNMKVWWFMPPYNPKQPVDRVAPNGWPTNAPEMIDAARKRTHGVRDLNFSFLGQVTHERRSAMIEALGPYLDEGVRTGRIGKCHILGTHGFTEGEPREKYYEIMVRSKIVLCPSGPCTPDSFRFAEALEAGCVPIVDNLTPKPDYPGGYWDYIFKPVNLFPFPVVNFWENVSNVIDHVLPRFDEISLECKFWWQQQKELMIATMKEDLCGI